MMVAESEFGLFDMAVILSGPNDWVVGDRISIWNDFTGPYEGMLKPKVVK